MSAGIDKFIKSDYDFDVAICSAKGSPLKRAESELFNSDPEPDLDNANVGTYRD
jgi:hypothetical protein